MGNVNEWLADESREYWTGVALYASMKCNKNIARLLQAKESKANMAKLVYELGKFSKQPVLKVKTVDAAIDQLAWNASTLLEKLKAAESSAYNQIEIIQKRNEETMLKNLPQELHSARIEATNTFLENVSLKMQLNLVPEESEDEAFSIQTRIDENFKRNALCWKKIDYWLEHRALPAESKGKFDELTPERKVLRRQQLYSSVSKLKTRIASYRKTLALPDLSVKVKTKTEKALAKSEKALLTQEQEIIDLTKLIDGI